MKMCENLHNRSGYGQQVYILYLNYSLKPLGGPDGELGASLRYFSQKFDMVTEEGKAILNDIATEELVLYTYQ